MMTKKILAVVTVLAVMLTACSMMAFAAETTTPSDVEEIVLKLEANGALGTMDPIAPDANGEVVVPDEKAFSNPNFNFKGWNTSADGAGTAYKTGDKITLAETLTLFAQWEHKDANIVEYTVTYDANGGQGETVDEYGPYIAGGYAYTAYNDFYSTNGATFVGWNTAKDGSGTLYGEDEMFEIFSDVVLYAMWEGGEEIVEDETVKDDAADSDAETQEDVTNTDTNNPSTGSTSAAGVAVAGVVALGALILLKKRD